MEENSVNPYAAPRGESLASVSASPWYFQEQDGGSFSRANSLRPMHSSTRRYFAYAAVFGLSLGVVTYIGAFLDEFDADDRFALYGYAVMGTCFLVMGGIALMLLALNVLRSASLARMSRSALRRRLRKEQKSYRFVAQRGHLRGMAIGAVFFAGLCVLSAFMGILVQLGVVVLEG